MSHLVFNDLKIEIKCQNKKITNNTRKKNFSPIPENVVKTLRNNTFLSILLDKRYSEWRSALLGDLIHHFATYEFNQDNLIIKCTLNTDMRNYNELAKNWEKKINSIITSFTNQFSADQLSLDDYDSKMVIEAIQQFNQLNGICIGYRVVRRKLFIVGKKNDAKEFLNSLQGGVLKKSKNVDFIIPKLEDESYYSLINPLIERLRKTYQQIEYIFYDSQTKKIQLRGPGNLVDEVLMLISDVIPKIRSDKLRSISQDSLNCPDVVNILENISNFNKLLCIFVKKIDALYLVYFNDCPQIDSPMNQTFQEMDSCIAAYYTCTKIDFLKHTEVLNGTKWSEFKIDNLLVNQDITFSLVDSKQSKELVMFGRKEVIFDLELKVQNFLDENKLVSKVALEFPQNDVSFND
jgi:hypothetical protein